jgi:uncharacterized protein
MKWFTFAVVALVLLAGAHARSGHITALSIINENSTTGGIADIYLEIKPGHGAVYIESFPYTKLDTQVSTRVAKEIACQRSSVDCNEYDFFYFINVPSSVVGGPSAGGAITVLTYAVLEDAPIANDTAMTGSILSGGIIGPVGGVRGKVAAAAANGYRVVLIPAWEEQEGIPLSDRYNVSVVRVRNIDEAIAWFTGMDVPEPALVTPPEGYSEGMEQVSRSLCERARLLAESLDESNLSRQAFNQYHRGVNETNNESYYSAASLCFSSALMSQTELFSNKTSLERQELLRDAILDRGSLEDALDRTTAKTIADLEIVMVVSERLSDVRERVSEMNSSDPSAAQLAYVFERIETAHAWYSLFGKIESKEVEITPERVALSCKGKLDEAQERVNYLSYLYPAFSTALEQSLRDAFSAAQEQDYFLCLLQASQAKAEANALLTALYVPEDEFVTVVDEKLSSSHAQLARQQAMGTFPILSYSYAQYSKSLLASEPYSASLYAEYSLELGMLDIYFPARRSGNIMVDERLLLVFATGVALGLIVGIVVAQFLQKPTQSKKVTIARNLPGKKR